jgi:hypothetical protein
MRKYIALADRWARKLHIYASLLTFSAMVLFGVVGIIAALEPKPAERERPPIVKSTAAYKAPSGLDDAALGAAIREHLNLPMKHPLIKPWIRKDASGRPQYDFNGPNGLHRVTYDEASATLEIDQQRTSLAAYLTRIHEFTTRARIDDWRVRGWAYYVEFSIWALFVMLVTSLWLWLYARWKDKGAFAAIVVGGGATVWLWGVLRY